MPQFTTQCFSKTAAAFAFFAAACFGVTAQSAVPETINYQAYLTNADGTPVDQMRSVSVVAFNVEQGGQALWGQTQSVMIEQGLFSIVLGGSSNPFPSGLFERPVYIGLFVDGEQLLPRRALTANAFALKARDAETLEGASAADLDQSGEVISLQGDVATAQNNIGTLQSSVGDNDARITSLENTAGDITSVVGGAGLTGGGFSGGVLLAVGQNAVTSAMIADGTIDAQDLRPSSVGSDKLIDNSVASIDIEDGTILPADISSSGNFEVNGLTTGFGGLTVGTGGTGGLTIASSSNINIFDDGNNLFWFNSGGTTQLAGITVTQSNMSMSHTAQGNTIFESNATGIGLGGASPSPGYTVSVPDLNVEGTANLGHEIVLLNYEANSVRTNCPAHGNRTCYIGSATVFCPTGKKVVGGGNAVSAGDRGSMSASRPSGPSAWACSASFDNANNSLNCYAICVSVD